MDDTLELDMLMAGLAPVIKSFVDKATAPLYARIAALESRPPEEKSWKSKVDLAIAEGRASLAEQCNAGTEFLRRTEKEVSAILANVKDGAPGQDGKDIDPAFVEKLVVAEVAKFIPKDGRDGKDADPALIAQLVDTAVSKAVAEIPAPKDGVDGKSVDPVLVEQLVVTAVEKAIAGLPVLQDGKDADPEFVINLVKEAVAAIPQPKDGAPGKDVEPEVVEQLIIKHVDAAVAKLPVPKDGKDGVNGFNGKDGAPGKDVDFTVVESLITEKVAGAVSAIPKPRDGRDGLQGERGADGRDGLPGKDADPEYVRSLVKSEVELFAKTIRVPVDGHTPTTDELLPLIEKAVAALPKPKDGQDGKSVDWPEVEEAIHKAVSAIPIPRDGRDVDWEAVQQKLSDLVVKTVSEIPPARDGIDGKSVELTQVKALVDEAVSRLPVPKDGLPGKDGASGLPGRDVDPADIEKLVEKAVSAIPIPKDGKSVELTDVLPFIEEVIDRKVSAIPAAKDGRDGVSIKELLIDQNGDLVFTDSLGETKRVGRVVGSDVDMVAVERTIKEAVAAIPRPVDGTPGHDGKDGVDGKDGLGFDDISIEYDGERSFTLKAVCGDRVKERTVKIPVMLDRGVWEPKLYEKGDTVTFAGSTFIAQRDTTDKPETENSGWRLSTKRGRDGKDFRAKDALP